MAASRPARPRNDASPVHPVPAIPLLQIIVAHSERLMLRGLASMLASLPGVRVIGEATELEHARRLCAARGYDVVLTSVALGRSSRVPAVPALLAIDPAARILALAPHAAERCFWEREGLDDRPGEDCLAVLLAQGALGVLRPDAGRHALASAVKSVARRVPWLDASDLQRLASVLRTRPESGSGLTPREDEVAHLLGLGRSNKEIAAALSLSPLTVKKHVGNILQKTHLLDRLHVGLAAARCPFFGGQSMAAAPAAQDESPRS